MNCLSPAVAPSRVVLSAETAADLMTPNPVSIREDAAINEAVAFLVDKGFSAAPVIDKAGRPIGVLSRADIIVHDRERVDYTSAVRERAPEGLADEFQVAIVDRTPVRDIMTPVVFSVAPETRASKVVENLLNLRVHRMFVVDHDEVLIGVISIVDVLRHLRLEETLGIERSSI